MHDPLDTEGVDVVVLDVDVVDGKVEDDVTRSDPLGRPARADTAGGPVELVQSRIVATDVERLATRA